MPIDGRHCSTSTRRGHAPLLGHNHLSAEATRTEGSFGGQRGHRQVGSVLPQLCASRRPQTPGPVQGRPKGVDALDLPFGPRPVARSDDKCNRASTREGKSLSLCSQCRAHGGCGNDSEPYQSRRLTSTGSRPLCWDDIPSAADTIIGDTPVAGQSPVLLCFHENGSRGAVAVRIRARA